MSDDDDNVYEEVVPRSMRSEVTADDRAKFISAKAAFDTAIQTKNPTKIEKTCKELQYFMENVYMAGAAANRIVKKKKLINGSAQVKDAKANVDTIPGAVDEQFENVPQLDKPPGQAGFPPGLLGIDTMATIDTESHRSDPTSTTMSFLSQSSVASNITTSSSETQASTATDATTNDTTAPMKPKQMLLEMASTCVELDTVASVTTARCITECADFDKRLIRTLFADCVFRKKPSTCQKSGLTNIQSESVRLGKAYRSLWSTMYMKNDNSFLKIVTKVSKRNSITISSYNDSSPNSGDSVRWVNAEKQPNGISQNGFPSSDSVNKQAKLSSHECVFQIWHRLLKSANVYDANSIDFIDTTGAMSSPECTLQVKQELLGGVVKFLSVEPNKSNPADKNDTSYSCIQKVSGKENNSIIEPIYPNRFEQRSNSLTNFLNTCVPSTEATCKTDGQPLFEDVVETRKGGTHKSHKPPFNTSCKIEPQNNVNRRLSQPQHPIPSQTSVTQVKQTTNTLRKANRTTTRYGVGAGNKKKSLVWIEKEKIWQMILQKSCLRDIVFGSFSPFQQASSKYDVSQQDYCSFEVGSVLALVDLLGQLANVCFKEAVLRKPQRKPPSQETATKKFRTQTDIAPEKKTKSKKVDPYKSSSSYYATYGYTGYYPYDVSATVGARENNQYYYVPTPGESEITNRTGPPQLNLDESDSELTLHEHVALYLIVVLEDLMSLLSKVEPLRREALGKVCSTVLNSLLGRVSVLTAPMMKCNNLSAEPPTACLCAFDIITTNTLVATERLILAATGMEPSTKWAPGQIQTFIDVAAVHPTDQRFRIVINMMNNKKYSLKIGRLLENGLKTNPNQTCRLIGQCVDSNPALITPDIVNILLNDTSALDDQLLTDIAANVPQSFCINDLRRRMSKANSIEIKRFCLILIKLAESSRSPDTRYLDEAMKTCEEDIFSKTINNAEESNTVSDRSQITGDHYRQHIIFMMKQLQSFALTDKGRPQVISHLDQLHNIREQQRNESSVVVEIDRLLRVLVGGSACSMKDHIRASISVPKSAPQPCRPGTVTRHDTVRRISQVCKSMNASGTCGIL